MIPLVWGAALWVLPALCAGPPDVLGQRIADPSAMDGVPESLRAADEPADGLADSVLLLRSGGLLRGRITRTEERYIVAVPGGGISVRAGDVQQHCRDVAEAYRVKRAMARLDAAQDHIELAQWCQKVGLPQHAAEELAEAKAVEPSHPMLPLVERQLRVAAQSKEQTGAPAKPNVTGPSVPDLDRMVRAMPPKTVETFTQVIQPMLVSHCASAACHGPGAQNRLQLLRPPPGSLPSRRLTQRNLFSVLEWVDRDDPGKSPLLAIPTRPHGTTRAPIFTNNQTAIYGQLLDWCCRVSRAPSPVMHASYEQPVSGGRSEPGSASAARAAMRAQRNQERDATKAAGKQRTPQALPPFSAAPTDAAPPDGAFPLTRRGGMVPRASSGEPSDPQASQHRPVSPAGLDQQDSGGLRPPDRSDQP